MCTLRHILPQGVMTTFNKATEEGLLKWVNLADATHMGVRVCVRARVCMCKTIASATAFPGSKSRNQGRVKFSSSVSQKMK